MSIILDHELGVHTKCSVNVSICECSETVNFLLYVVTCHVTQIFIHLSMNVWIRFTKCQFMFAKDSLNVRKIFVECSKNL